MILLLTARPVEAEYQYPLSLGAGVDSYHVFLRFHARHLWWSNVSNFIVLHRDQRSLLPSLVGRHSNCADLQRLLCSVRLAREGVPAIPAVREWERWWLGFVVRPPSYHAYPLTDQCVSPFWPSLWPLVRRCNFPKTTTCAMGRIKAWQSQP
jgi:hypothetical protein